MLISDINTTLNNPDSFLYRCIMYGVKKRDGSIRKGIFDYFIENLKNKGLYNDWLCINKILSKVMLASSNALKVGMKEIGIDY